MVRSSVLDAVIGLLALTTVTSPPPSLAPSVTRAATPMPATSVAQTSAIATTFRWVMRSALSIEKLFISPSPEVPCPLVAPAGGKVHAVGRKKMGRQSWLLEWRIPSDSSMLFGSQRETGRGAPPLPG